MEKLGKGIFLLVIVILFAASSALGQEVIKIGVIGPMQFVEGIHHWNGAVMAAEEINAKGGIQVGNKKMKIQLIKADSNEVLNPTDATNAMERLMTKDKVDFVLGGFRTEAVLPMQDIAMENKKIFIGNGAATYELYNRVVDTRRELGEDAIPFHKFAELIKDQVAHLRKSGAPEVAFRVSVKDGKLNFTARSLKGAKPGE